MTRDEGFTLVEVLVATFVMAILTAMGATLLSNVLDSRRQIASVVDQVEQLELARSILKRDLSQVTARRARDEFGLPARSVFIGGDDLDRDSLMSFVANGRELIGPAAGGSSLQHVEYRFVDGDLIRRSRDFVDAVQDSPMRDRVLLSDLRGVEARFLGLSGWLDFWSSSGGVVGANGVDAPLAVSLTLEHRRYGELEMVMLTPAGY